MSSPTTIAIINQKGGVGKTTTVINLAASLSIMGQNNLVIDLDPQGNATTGSGVEKSNLDFSVYDLLVGSLTIQDVLITQTADYDLLPSNSDLVAAEVELLKGENREVRLRKAIDQIRDHYEFVLIDCPPSLNMLTINALVAADGVVIPMQCEYYALEGLSQLMRTIDAVKAGLNGALSMQGIVLTMFDSRNKLSAMVANDVRDHFGELVYNTVVPRNVRVSEAPSFGQPVLIYDLKCPGSQAYAALAAELLRLEEMAA